MMQSSDGRWWCRTANGQWVLWQSGRWMAVPGDGAMPMTQSPPGNTRPRTFVTYPNESRHVFFGIDWYLNGRGPFSD
jgi:hypothetical protein